MPGLTTLSQVDPGGSDKWLQDLVVDAFERGGVPVAAEGGVPESVLQR